MTYSASPPFVALPRIPNESHNDHSPRRHDGHRPHERLGFKTPRTPRGRRTPRPTPATAPPPPPGGPADGGRRDLGGVRAAPDVEVVQGRREDPEADFAARGLRGRE